MRYAGLVLKGLFVLLVFLFLDYTLPSRETVRITNTYNRLTDLGANRMFYADTGTGAVENAAGQRDIRFIDTVKPNGRPRVYRNEDTGWIWPPYFKYDSSNLQAVATDLQSTAGDPRWVSVTSYGWRVAWMTIYPNAVAITPVAGPDSDPLNWAALLILALLGLLLLLFWRMWAQFRQRTLGPAWDRVDARADAARERMAERRRGLRGWLDRRRR
ncbi:DUF1523 family protein [Paracoccus sp. S-4012]|uniref:DUF1523 family protein n=1 Tax=Paracoccus sp. S-4012 TaxID=2665648 RepID=UPI0012AF0FC1|nr:DUF1523 family protein [Paracoccus sp. S-4012]MRX50228.1 DUF1523 family protein [Paracoccus sp. S-4012]